MSDINFTLTEQNTQTPEQPKHHFNNISDFEQEPRNSLKMKIIGVGGAGCNVINHINKNYPTITAAAEIYAFNTDIGSLRLVENVGNKFLLNKEELKGYGSGGDPEVGRRAVEHDAEVIKEELKGTDILFIVAGLGKGAGSGGAPELAKIAKSLGILTIGIVNIPAVACEGNNIYNNAFNALQTLATYADSISTISNEKITSNKKDVSLFDAYSLANDEIANIIEDIVNIIFKPTSMNVDFSDLKSFFKKNSFFLMNRIGFDANNISESTIKNALVSKIKSSYTDIEVSKAKDAICNISMSKTTPANFIHFVNRALAEFTNNASISLVTGIEYNDTNNIELSFLIAGKSQIGDISEMNKETEKAKWHNPDTTDIDSDEDTDLNKIVKDLEEANTPTIDLNK